MVYPNSNLPSASQPWGKAIQKDLEKLQAAVATNEINNKARDTQLEKNYKRLDATVGEVAAVAVSAANAAAQAQSAANTANSAASAAGAAASAANAAINDITGVKSNIYVPGTTNINGNVIETGTIIADAIAADAITGKDISGGTITGTTITGGSFRTSSSGSRIEVSGTSLRIYTGSTYDGQIAAGGSSVGLNHSSGAVVSTGSFGVVLSAGTITADGNLGVSGTITNSTGGNVNMSGGLNLSGGLTVGTISGSSSWTNSNLAGVGTVALNVNSSGTLVRSSSSERFKQDILDLDTTYQDVISMEPKSFRRKDEVAELGDNAPEYGGFIAEDLAGTSLDRFVFYQELEDGTRIPEGIHYAELTAALVVAIKQQHNMLQSLTDRIEALEGK